MHLSILIRGGKGAGNGSNLEYADVVWDGGPQYESDWLESVQTDAGRIITGGYEGYTQGECITRYWFT